MKNQLISRGSDDPNHIYKIKDQRTTHKNKKIKNKIKELRKGGGLNSQCWNLKVETSQTSIYTIK